MNREIWKQIAGYEELYEISSFGNVRSLDRVVPHTTKRQKRCAGKTISHDINWAGYHRVTLFKEHKRTRYAVHRLVAEAFVPNINNLPQINHKDENPHNNCASNLEWCDNKYNINYGTRTERASSHLRKPVLQLDMNGAVVGRYISQNEAERQTGILQSCISRVCLGGARQSGGYIWRYE